MTLELPYYPFLPPYYHTTLYFCHFSSKHFFYLFIHHTSQEKGEGKEESLPLVNSGLAQKSMLLPHPPFRFISCNRVGKKYKKVFSSSFKPHANRNIVFCRRNLLTIARHKFSTEVTKKMELRSLILQSNSTPLFPSFTCCFKPSFKSMKTDQKVYKFDISRRVGILTAITSVILAGEGIFGIKIANGFDFGFVAPDQTVEEAESGVRNHAQALLEVKDLLETESWKEAQKALRRSSALLKKDIYTIINSKPGSERPPLRKLYSSLFNNVSRLDYAARDKDTQQVWQCYDSIVVAVNDFLSRLYPS